MRGKFADGKCLFALAAVHVSSGFAAPSLPPFAGNVSGEVAVFGDAGPRLKWRVDASTRSSGQRQARLTIGGPATRVVAQVDLDPTTGDGAWRIEEGRLQITPWVQALGDQLPPEVRGIEFEGAIVLTGAGEIRQRTPTGRIKFTWSEGVIRDAERGVTLEGVTVSGEADVATLPDGEMPLTLSVRTIATGRFGARHLAVEAMLRGLRELVVTSAQIEIAGGEMTADPFVMPLSPLVVSAHVKVARIGLQDVVALFPSGLSEARGRVDGDVWLGWSAAAGIQVGEGRLALHAEEPATLRLAPTPGFLTERVPRRVELLPAWLGPIARWFSPKNPAYDDLEDVELGRTELRVETFDARITPDGDGLGRSAHIAITARPLRADGEIEEVTFDVNVAGPLADVLKIGMTQPFSVEVR